MVAALAEIGVAEAALYPDLRLPGRLTLSADGLGTGSVVETVLAALTATLDIPLFDAGGRQAEGRRGGGAGAPGACSTIAPCC